MLGKWRNKDDKDVTLCCILLVTFTCIFFETGSHFVIQAGLELMFLQVAREFYL
jgi:hypothetical protein